MFLWLATATYAQTIAFDEFNMPMYNARVKFIDEFFSRFNAKENSLNVDDKYSNRETNILLLFNRFLFKSKTDSLFLSAKMFSEKVVQDSIYLNYTDKAWYAKVKCNGTLNKKEIDFFLYLMVEKRGEHMYKWVIADAEGEIFNTSRHHPHNELFILPNDHEQSFLSLKRVTNETSKYIDDYVKQGYEASPLSVFLTLVRCGQLKIDYVSDVEFNFLQVPNYSFSVKYFERNDMNLGWLISSFERCNDTKKENILNSLYCASNYEIKNVKDNDATLSNSIFSEQFDIVSTDSTNFINDSISGSELVVRRFGNIIHLWMETGDVDYQKKAIKECAGKKGKECMVNDGLMCKFAIMNNLPQNNIYSLRDYMSGLMLLTESGNSSIEFTNIRQIEENDEFYIVLCDIKLSGEADLNVTDVFYIRKFDNKVFRILSLNNH